MGSFNPGGAGGASTGGQAAMGGFGMPAASMGMMMPGFPMMGMMGMNGGGYGMPQQQQGGGMQRGGANARGGRGRNPFGLAQNGGASGGYSESGPPQKRGRTESEY